MFGLTRKPLKLVTAEDALPGRPEPIPTAELHAVFGRPLKADPPGGMERATFGMGCFWGAERLFWQTPGVWLTRVGYAGGHTPNPTYEEVCTGLTGHAEVVDVIFDPATLPYAELLRLFWENHDPTQGMRQGNDIGTQYRSAIHTHGAEQAEAAAASARAYGEKLRVAGFGPVTTEIRPAPEFFYAEAYHQQYLHKNPGGYCGLAGTGVSCPVGTGVR